MHFTEDEYCSSIATMLMKWFDKSGNNEGLATACRDAGHKYMSITIGWKARTQVAQEIIDTVKASNALELFTKHITTGNWEVEGHSYKLMGIKVGCASLNTLLMQEAIKQCTEALYQLISQSDDEKLDNPEIINAEVIKLYDDTRNLATEKLQARCLKIYQTLMASTFLARPNNPTLEHGMIG